MIVHNTPGKIRKQADQITRKQNQKRMRDIVNKFNEDIKDFSELDRKKMFRDLVKQNPDVLDTYGAYPLNEDDVMEMVRDVNLSDRQVLKILTIIRRKWGKHKVTSNIKTTLKERKQLLSHLFTVEYLDKDDPVHFVDKDGKPISR